MNSYGKSRAFLTEFIIVILFFSLSAIVILQILVKSKETSDLSTNRTVAYNNAESVAEMLKKNSIYKVFSKENGWTKKEDNSYSMDFGKDWVEQTDKPSYNANVKIHYDKMKNGYLVYLTLSYKDIRNAESINLCTLNLTYYKDSSKEVLE